MTAYSRPAALGLLMVFVSTACVTKTIYTPAKILPYSPVPGPVQPLAQGSGPTPTEASFQKDRAAILKLAGKFRVTFDFHETIAIKAGYSLRPPYKNKATEIVIVVEDSGRKIDLQHILQIGRKVTKHWRQTWTYEDTTHFEFRGSRTWVPRKISEAAAKGTWTQRVWQVDDSPRYAGVGRWEHVGNLSSWQANAWRPLPRREYSKRSDYHVLVATNRQTVTTKGWIHEQDNYKMVLGQKEPSILAREVGLNVYTRDDTLNFDRAMHLWNATAKLWIVVRKAWDKALTQHKRFQLRKVWNGKPLMRHMYALAWYFYKNRKAKPNALDEVVGRLQTVISNFIVPSTP